MYCNTIITVITNDSLLPHSQVSNYPNRYKDGTLSETYSFVQLHYTRKVVIIKNLEKFEFTAIFTTFRYQFLFRDE